jgi:hypothetical protein
LKRRVVVVDAFETVHQPLDRPFTQDVHESDGRF